MSLPCTLRILLRRFPFHGVLSFHKEQKWSAVTRSVPNAPGVYIILRDCSSIREIRHAKANIAGRVLYIGHSGTLSESGRFKNQLLMERISRGKQFGGSRRKTIQQKMKHEKLSGVTVLWIATVWKNRKTLPAFIELLLLQEYWQDPTTASLPPWNKQA